MTEEHIALACRMAGCPARTIVCGWDDVQLSPRDRAVLIRTGERPPIPALLGVRLAIRRHEAIPGEWLNDNVPAVYLMADSHSGLAPPSWLPNGIGSGGTGPVTVASLDGPYSAVDAALLHDYIDRLMDMWGGGRPTDQLDPRAFQRFLRTRIVRVANPDLRGYSDFDSGAAAAMRLDRARVHLVRPRVRLAGLSALALNGQVGFVGRWARAQGRFEVFLDGGRDVSVKPDNLVALGDDVLPLHPPAARAGGASARGDGAACAIVHLPARPFASREELFALLERDTQMTVVVRRWRRRSYLEELREAHAERAADDAPAPPAGDGAPPVSLPPLPPDGGDDDGVVDDDDADGLRDAIAARYGWSNAGGSGLAFEISRAHAELFRIPPHDAYLLHFDDNFLNAQPAHNPAATLLLGTDVFGSCLITRGEARPFDERTWLYNFPPEDTTRELTLREIADLVWSRRDAAWEARARERVEHIAQFMARPTPLAAPAAAPAAARARATFAMPSIILPQQGPTHAMSSILMPQQGWRATPAVAPDADTPSTQNKVEALWSRHGL